MRIAELLKALEDYDDNAHVVVGLSRPLDTRPTRIAEIEQAYIDRELGIVVIRAASRSFDIEAVTHGHRLADGQPA